MTEGHRVERISASRQGFKELNLQGTNSGSINGGKEMKEIRFRAWLKKENRMIDPVIGLDLSNPYPTIQWFENEHDVLSNNVSDCFMDECELMQYTGLKDKNGKEIYESDIVTARERSDTAPFKGYVHFENGQYWVNYIGYESYYLPLIQLINAVYEPIEIISNIYESPTEVTP